MPKQQRQIPNSSPPQHQPLLPVIPLQMSNLSLINMFKQIKGNISSMLEIEQMQYAHDEDTPFENCQYFRSRRNKFYHDLAYARIYCEKFIVGDRNGILGKGGEEQAEQPIVYHKKIRLKPQKTPPPRAVPILQPIYPITHIDPFKRTPTSTLILQCCFEHTFILTSYYSCFGGISIDTDYITIQCIHFEAFNNKFGQPHTILEIQVDRKRQQREVRVGVAKGVKMGQAQCQGQGQGIAVWGLTNGSVVACLVGVLMELELELYYNISSQEQLYELKKRLLIQQQLSISQITHIQQLPLKSSSCILLLIGTKSEQLFVVCLCLPNLNSFICNSCETLQISVLQRLCCISFSSLLALCQDTVFFHNTHSYQQQDQRMFLLVRSYERELRVLQLSYFGVVKIWKIDHNTLHQQLQSLLQTPLASNRPPNRIPIPTCKQKKPQQCKIQGKQPHNNIIFLEQITILQNTSLESVQTQSNQDNGEVRGGKSQQNGHHHHPVKFLPVFYDNNASSVVTSLFTEQVIKSANKYGQYTIPVTKTGNYYILYMDLNSCFEVISWGTLFSEPQILISTIVIDSCFYVMTCSNGQPYCWRLLQLSLLKLPQLHIIREYSCSQEKQLPLLSWHFVSYKKLLICKIVHFHDQFQCYSSVYSLLLVYPNGKMEIYENSILHQGNWSQWGEIKNELSFANQTKKSKALVKEVKIYCFPDKIIKESPR